MKRYGESQQASLDGLRVIRFRRRDDGDFYCVFSCIHEMMAAAAHRNNKSSNAILTRRPIDRLIL